MVTADHLIELNTPRLGFTTAEQERVLEQEGSIYKGLNIHFYPTCWFFNLSGGSVVGGSVKTESAADVARQGSAYKIYGCGLMFNRNMTRVNIIVPLTSMIVMPY